MEYKNPNSVNDESLLLDRLVSLRMPSLAGKRFLNIECNKGFFCGYALFDGATSVVGVDKNAENITYATKNFPDADFINGSWSNLSENSFDVIFLHSVLHEYEHQDKIIHRLLDFLANDGLLILEVSIVPSSKNEFCKINITNKTYYLPTHAKLNELLEDYAWKIIGDSVNNNFFNLPKYVIHIRNFKPYVWLLMQEPGSGKSTVSRRTFNKKSDVPIISGDHTYLLISNGKIKVSDELYFLVSEGFTTDTIGRTTQKVFEAGFASELATVWANQVGYRDFTLDSYVPEKYREQIKNALHSLGYFPIEMSWNNKTPLLGKTNTKNKAASYKDFIARKKTNNKITIRNKKNSLVRWHLDYPREEESYSKEDCINIIGWAIVKKQITQPYKIYIDRGLDITFFSPNQARPDVLNMIFKTSKNIPRFWQQHPCGYSFNIPTAWLTDGIEFGLKIKNKLIPLAEITLSYKEQKNLGLRIIKKIKGIY